MREGRRGFGIRMRKKMGMGLRGISEYMPSLIPFSIYHLSFPLCALRALLFSVYSFRLAVIE